MGNWYHPPCEPIQYSFDEDLKLVLQEVEGHQWSRRRTLTLGSESPRRVIFYADADHLQQCEKDDVDDLGRYCAEIAGYLRDVDQLSTPYLFQYGDKALTDGLGVVNLPHMRKTRGIATTQQVSRVTSDDASCHPQPLTDRLEPIVVPISASVRVAALPQVAPNDIPWEQKKVSLCFEAPSAGATNGIRTITRVQTLRNAKTSVAVDSFGCFRNPSWWTHALRISSPMSSFRTQQSLVDARSLARDSA